MKSNPWKPESLRRWNNFFGGGGHVRVFDAANDCGVAGGMSFLEHFKVEAGEYGALPAERGAGGFFAGDVGLRVDGEALATKSGQMRVVSWSRARVWRRVRKGEGLAIRGRRARRRPDRALRGRRCRRSVPLALRTVGKLDWLSHL